MIDLQTTLAVIELFLIFSILYKENFLFRIGVGLYIGSSLGYSAITAFDNIWKRVLIPLSGGQFLLIIPLILGCLLFTTQSRKLVWISRYPSAIVIGAGVGSATAGIIVSQVFKQMLGTAVITDINSGILAIMVILLLFYFLMTVPHEGTFAPIGWLSKAGRWVLMIFFGVGLGAYAVARYSHVVGRIQYVLITWLGL